MGRRNFLSVVAIVALLAAFLGLWAATPASAATKPIGLSFDGVTFTDDLPSALYAGAVIVPGDELLESFYVQNRAADPGNLAITLQDVSGVDSILISALSVRAAAGISASPSVGFPAANPCASLISGVGLASGAVIRVDVRLKLSSSLSGLTSQASIGRFNIGVTLTSTDVAPPTGCSAVTPPTGGTGHGGHGTPPGQIDSTVVTGTSDGSLPDVGGHDACYVNDDGIETIVATGDSFPGQAGVGCYGVAAAIVQPNTGRFFQEFDVVAWIGLAILGGIFAAWRRSKDPEDVYAPGKVYA